MPGTLNPAEALAHEFGTHYLADELPHSLAERLPSLYDGTASRLRAVTAPQERGALVALLRAA